MSPYQPFGKIQKKNMIMNKTYTYFGSTITPIKFLRGKNTLIKEWSTHMHIEEQGTNFELKRAIFLKDLGLLFINLSLLFYLFVKFLVKKKKKKLLVAKHTKCRFKKKN